MECIFNKTHGKWVESLYVSGRGLTGVAISSWKAMREPELGIW